MNKYTLFILFILFILLTACGKPTEPIQNSSTIQVTLTPEVGSTETSIPSVSPTTITPSPTPVCSIYDPTDPNISMELFGNFHTLGVIVGINDMDPDHDSSALVEYRKEDGDYQDGFPLSRVSDHEFIGSLFWLEPGSTYKVRVSFIDEGDILHCSAITASTTTRSDPINTESNNTLTVSPEGSGNICSRENPCSLSTGINSASPGDTVQLLGGVYYQGDINLPRSGSEYAPIVITGAPGEEAILDGSDPNEFSWNSLPGGIYETTTNAEEPTLVMVNGEERLYRYQSLEDLKNLTWGLPGFYSQRYRMYINLGDNRDPNELKMVIGRRMYGFWIERDYIHIKNITFRYYDVRWYRSGLYIRDGSNNLIQNCVFSHNGYGIILQGASHKNLIEKNEFYDSIYEWSWDAVKALHDNTGQGMETGGIKIYDPHRTNPQAMPRGTVIRNNKFHDFFDGISICSFENAVIPSNETDVYENEFFRLGDDGMEADGYCSNVRIFNNTIHDVLVGISLAPIWNGPTYVIRNLVYDIGKPSGCFFGKEEPCGGTGLKFQYSESGSGSIYLFHNTMDGGPQYYTVFIYEPAEWPLLLSRNNNWGSPRAGGGIGIEVDDPVDFDYDNIFSQQNKVLVYYRGIDYYSLDDFSTTTGQEENGLSKDPQFVNIPAGNYTLLPSSPLIDSGLYIPGINQDYQGLGPDIGAYEYTPQ